MELLSSTAGCKTQIGGSTSVPAKHKRIQLIYGDAISDFIIVKDSSGEVHLELGPGLPGAESAVGRVTRVSEPGFKSPSLANRTGWKASVHLDVPLKVKPLIGTTDISLLYDEYAFPFGPIKVGDRLDFEFSSEGKFLAVMPAGSE